eukprot:gene58082-biopygen63532
MGAAELRLTQVVPIFLLLCPLWCAGISLPYCALRTNRSVSCWGETIILSELRPAGVAPVPADLKATPFAAVCTGRQHACGLLHPTGVARCWGEGKVGNATGNGDIGYDDNAGQSSPPESADGIPYAYVAITCGSRSTCAIAVADGSLRCWGAIAPPPQ